MSNSLQQMSNLALLSLHENNTELLIERLQTLLEALETKEDPEPHEIKLYSELTIFLEKIQLLENSLKLTVLKEKAVYDKLGALYDQRDKNIIFY